MPGRMLQALPGPGSRSTIPPKRSTATRALPVPRRRSITPQAINRNLGASRPPGRPVPRYPSAPTPTTLRSSAALRIRGTPSPRQAGDLVDDRDPVVDVGDARRGPGEGDGVIVLGPGAHRPGKNNHAGKGAVGRYLEPVQPGTASKRGADRLLDVVVARGWAQRDRDIDAHHPRHGRAGELGLVALELPGRDAGQGDEAGLDAG